MIISTDECTCFGTFGGSGKRSVFSEYQEGFAFSVYGQAKKWKTCRSRKGYWIKKGMKILPGLKPFMLLLATSGLAGSLRDAPIAEGTYTETGTSTHASGAAGNNGKMAEAKQTLKKPAYAHPS